MGVGAIGAIGTTGFRPYVYNSRQLSSASLNAVKAISDDPSEGGADAAGLVKTEVTSNRLKKGETSDLAGILLQQFSQSDRTRSLVFDSSAAGSTASDSVSEGQNAYIMNRAAAAYSEAGAFA